MAINVNKVYKTVLSILNKEQRGYLNPSEFNNLAKQCQLEILDSLFYDYNKFLNLENVNRTNEGYADIADKIQEQIDVHYAEHNFTATDPVNSLDDYSVTTGIGTLPSSVYRVIDLSIGNTLIEKIDKNRLSYLNSSPLTKPSSTFPVYYQSSNAVNVNPVSTTVPKLRYIKLPDEPRFGYSVNATYGTNVYDTNPYVASGLVKDRELTSGATVTSDTAGTTAALDTTVSPDGGTGLTLKVTSDGVNITKATVVAVGSGYSIGDVVTVSDTAMEADTSIGTTGGDYSITLQAPDLYSGSTKGSTNFTLHESLETNLVISILGYAGLIIKDPSVIQAATQIGTSSNISKAQQ